MYTWLNKNAEEIKKTFHTIFSLYWCIKLSKTKKKHTKEKKKSIA